MHHLLKERAQEVVILVDGYAIADEVEDLRDAAPEDLDSVRFVMEEPHVVVQLGIVPYVTAGDGQEARELARDAHSLVSLRKRPAWQNFVALTVFRVLGYGPGVIFLAAVTLCLFAATFAYKQLLKVDFATPVLPERRREARSRAVQGWSGTKWGGARRAA
ncbi:hypothetical protein ACX6XY_06965 [Streptomyces sp. O3]